MQTHAIALSKSNVKVSEPMLIVFKPPLYNSMTDANETPVGQQNNALAPQGQASSIGSSSIGSSSGASSGPHGSNMLKHIEALEKQKATLESELRSEKVRNEKMSAKTREGMQSALDTLMKKWMDAVETKDDKIKDQFKDGMNKLVQNSAEENGVWQMMVAASSLHERQTHDLDKLRDENEEMRKNIDGRFANSESRKRPADEQLDRTAVDNEACGSMWNDFAKELGGLY